MKRRLYGEARFFVNYSVYLVTYSRLLIDCAQTKPDIVFTVNSARDRATEAWVAAGCVI